VSVREGVHWGNFTLKSGGDQWRRQDLVSGGHDNRGAEGASIEVPKTPSGVGYEEGVRFPADYYHATVQKILIRQVLTKPMV